MFAETVEALTVDGDPDHVVGKDTICPLTSLTPRHKNRNNSANVLLKP